VWHHVGVFCVGRVVVGRHGKKKKALGRVIFKVIFIFIFIFKEQLLGKLQKTKIE
jgi:hypothetical protein